MSSTPLKIFVFVSVITTSSTMAADRPDAGQFLKESTPPPSLAPVKEPPDFQNPVMQKKQNPDGVLVKVAGFTFVGNTVFSSDELSKLMSECIGKEMTFARLNDSSTAITKAYRKKGYFLASLFFPPQTVQPGMPLTIEISEGVLESIHVETRPIHTRTRKSLLEAYASQVAIEQPLNEGSLTSMVMKTNELPNISSRILLEPGSRPGTTQATLEVTEGRPYSFSFDIDNYGNPATGKNHAGSTMELYSPFHLGDQFSVRLQTSTTGDLQNIQTGYSIPVTPYGTKIALNYNYVNYRLGGLFESLNAYGDGHNLTLAVTHPIIRHRALIVNATLAGEGSLLDDRVPSASFINRRHTTSLQAGISGIKKDHALGGGTTTFSIGFVGGRLDIDNSETIIIDQSSTGLQTKGSYSKLTMALARSQTIYNGLSLYTGAYGQWASKNLTSSEKIPLGGPSSVRAWQRGESYADKGIITTVELRYLFGSLGELPGTLEVSAFFDHGYALLHSNPVTDVNTNTCNVSGAGFGMKWLNVNNYSLQTTAAWKIHGESTPSDTPMIFVQAVKRF